MRPPLKRNQEACENAEENNFNHGNHLARYRLSQKRHFSPMSLSEATAAMLLLVCFDNKMRSAMEAFVVWLPKKDHSKYPTFLFVTSAGSNLKHDDLNKLHWTDLELAIKHREDQALLPLAGEQAAATWPPSTDASRHPRNKVTLFHGMSLLHFCSEHDVHHQYSPTLLTSYILFKCSSSFKLHVTLPNSSPELPRGSAIEVGEGLCHGRGNRYNSPLVLLWLDKYDTKVFQPSTFQDNHKNHHS